VDRLHLRQGSGLIARATDQTAAHTWYYHRDYLGSTRLITDSTGATVSSCVFDPFGNQMSCSPDDANNHYRFTGESFLKRSVR
jgi:uncharacterized protein RhaS with RHS repeats